MALFWRDDASSAEADNIVAQASRVLKLRNVARFSCGVVLASVTSPVVSLANGRGVVIGSVFPRSGQVRCINRFETTESERVIVEGGAHLIDEFWGEYVAFLIRDSGPIVLRDPSGALSCYTVQGGGLDAIVSDVEFGISLGLIDGEINWPALGHWLVEPGLRADSTCIKEVGEILPGTAWSRVGDSWRRQTAWTPWAFAAPGVQFTDRDDAVDALRDVTLRTTKACAAQSKSALLEMSGGLDSSIVAACLHKAEIPVACVSLWTTDPGGDERHYAQAVADRIRAPIDFVLLSAEDVDVANISPILKPRPIDHPLKRISDLILEREGLTRNVDSYFSGSGGDYVFGYLNSSAPAADALISRGPGRTFFSAVADVAELHSCSVWKVGALAIRRTWRRTASKTIAARSFLSGDVRALGAQSHPWLAAPRNSWPGKRELIDCLIRSQGVREERDRRRIAPLRMPLLSQPVVETCLRIPSWMAVTQGRNRAVARDAFADRLPEKILKRRTKGNFTSFNAAIFERNRGVLRDVVLGGRLNAQNLLDKRALEEFFDSNRPLADYGYTKILELASVELWTRGWR